MKKTYSLGIIVLVVVSTAAVYELMTSLSSSNHSSLVSEHVLAEEPDREVIVSIGDGDTFGILAEANGISPQEVLDILAASEEVYDFTSIRAGKKLGLVFDHETDELIKLSYQPNTEVIVEVTNSGGSWSASERLIDYEIRQRTINGTIESSLYQSALDAGFDERAIIDLAETFGWQIDFGLDIRTGDTYTAIYEERYLDNEYIMPGEILAAKFVNAGTEYTGYRYERNDETVGYYDLDGNSLEKILLKSPLQYRYISSGFTSARYHPIIGAVTAHYAIDFAAAHGTPVVASGDGVVTSAGWSGGYGNMVQIRHNDTYTTRYGHFSRIAVSNGQRVEQNQIIGYVGSTGWSTGPHLHYEVYKSGTPVNPLNLELPSLEGLSEEELTAFQNYIGQFEL